MLSSDTVATILLIGAAQGLLLALVLLTLRRGNRIANRFLAMLMILFSVSIILHTLAHTKHLFDLPHHSGIGLVLYFLFGPLFYLYVKALTDRQFQLTPKQLLHLLPLGISALVYLIILLISTDSDNLSFIHDGLAWLVMLHVFIYIFLSIRALEKHTKDIKETFSSIEKVNLNWLRFLIIGYVATWVVALIMEGHGEATATWDVVWIVVSAWMYLIGYMGLRQPEIFSGEFARTSDVEKSSGEKYQKSTLTPEMADNYLQRLLQVMAKEKLYLQNDLTLPVLAKKLSVSTHHLSQVINEKLQQNFFEFVNSQRVDAAKEFIADPANRHKNLAEIGYEVGFNSITSFNSAFKKHTNTTPSEYRQSAFSGQPSVSKKM